jgi:hypothetical protein
MHKGGQTDRVTQEVLQLFIERASAIKPNSFGKCTAHINFLNSKIKK